MMMTQSLRTNLWPIIVGLLGLALTCGAMLVSATLWIDSAIRTSNDQSLAAIHAQADVFSKIQGLNESRITTLEVEQRQSQQVTNNLSDKVEKLGEAENSLSTSVQILSDKLPDLRKR